MDQYLMLFWAADLNCGPRETGFKVFKHMVTARNHSGHPYSKEPQLWGESQLLTDGRTSGRGVEMPPSANWGAHGLSPLSGKSMWEPVTQQGPAVSQAVQSGGWGRMSWAAGRKVPDSKLVPMALAMTSSMGWRPSEI